MRSQNLSVRFSKKRFLIWFKARFHNDKIFIITTVELLQELDDKKEDEVFTCEKIFKIVFLFFPRLQSFFKIANLCQGFKELNFRLIIFIYIEHIKKSLLSNFFFI